jgi:hypothetical protein
LTNRLAERRKYGNSVVLDRLAQGESKTGVSGGGRRRRRPFCGFGVILADKTVNFFFGKAVLELICRNTEGLAASCDCHLSMDQL